MQPEIEEVKKAPHNKILSGIKEFLKIAVISIVIVVPIRVLIAQPFVVSGASMDNTFQNGNYLIIDELSYKFENPNRGDVIVFKVPAAGLALQHEDLNKTVFYIKRIIGLPGETIEINGDEIKIDKSSSSTGTTLNEPYIYIDKSVPSAFSTIQEKVTLGKDEYFVMGDNRHNSSDSRLWGVLKRGNIKGRAFLRLFPISVLSTFPGEYNAY